ncbi:MAG TPA: hypothetical protein PLN86_16670 [Candidatus Hydrogenedentes bacterium]|nr:hypothetical protein [Candidatus Hydrogenedentota bacterium]
MRDAELLFAKNDLSEVLRAHEIKALDAIESFHADRLLNTSVEDLFQYFVAEYKVNPIRIFEDQISVDQAETKIDVSQDQLRLIHDRSEPFYVNGTRVTFFVPFEGDKTLLYCRASTFSFNPPRAFVSEKEIQFVFDRFDHNADGVKAAFESAIGSFKQHLEWTNRDVNQFNAQLPQKIRQKIEQRREKLLGARGMVASLGFPLKKRENAPTTYTAPVARKKIQSPPPASTAPYVPEPVLDMETYEQILKIMTSMVLVMERSPNAFRDMKEEDLRQHFLVQLNGQFEGQATGETFNYQGKTDILIRANGKNIFIAECKFWKGQKALIETINQLLGYVSWRDTKAAVLIFNRKKKFSEVVGAIPEIVKSHPNIKRELPPLSETSRRYLFHHNDDNNRELLLTVMAFDIPGNE